jgi:WD40 repeat protein
LEILAGGENGLIKLIDGNGIVKFEKSYKGKIAGAAKGDSLGAFYLLRESQNQGLISKESFTNPSMPPFSTGEISAVNNSLPISGDINRDSSLEVIVVGSDGKIYAWDSYMNLLPGFPIETGASNIKANPVLGDINNDGFLEIVLAYQDRVYAYSFNGTVLDYFLVTVIHPGGATDLIESSPILGDVDGDGYPDIIIGTTDNRVLAYNKDGRMVDGFPLTVNGAILSTPILLNMDKDVDAELLVASDDGFINGWDLPGEYKNESFPWVMYGHDAGHTNYFPEESLPPIPPPVGDLLPAKTVFNYPNPAKDHTKIRYFLKQDAKVNIRIYDLSGMLVDEFAGPGEGSTHNESTWDCDRFASGVYLCRVEAKSENDNQVVIFKVALVK